MDAAQELTDNREKSVISLAFALASSPLLKRGSRMVADFRLNDLAVKTGARGGQTLVARISEEGRRNYQVSISAREPAARRGETNGTGRTMLPILGRFFTEEQVMNRGAECLYLVCECGTTCRASTTTGGCSHMFASVRDIHQQLKSLTPLAAVEWFESLRGHTPQAGEHFLALCRSKVAPIRNSPSIESDDEPTLRLRFQIYPFGQGSHVELIVSAVLQKKNPKGKWVRGGSVDSLALRHPAYMSPAERRLVQRPRVRELLRLIGLGSGFSFWEAFPLLEDQLVVWAYGNDRQISLMEGDLQFKLTQHGETYQVELTLNGEPWVMSESTDVTFSRVEGDSGAILWDMEKNFICRCELPLAATYALESFLKVADSNCIELNARQAEELMSRFISRPDWLPTRLPESLAGPEVACDAEPIVFLEVRQDGGIVCKLVIQPGFENSETFVPGFEPRRATGLTSEGPVQWIRDLELEQQHAERIANELSLGSLDFVGPYHWIAPTDDVALKLLEGIRELGDDAPAVRWLNERQLSYAGEITSECLRLEIDCQKDWFGIHGTVRIDDNEIPLIALLSALRLGLTYVPLGNNAFARIADSLRERLGRLADLAPQDRDRLQVGRAAVPLVDELFGSDVPITAVAQWRDTVRRIGKIRGMEPSLPKAFKAELRDYQLAGFQWLSRLSQWGAGACLADDMGLGKTVQALAVLQQRASDGPALIVAPTSVGENWRRECDRFAPKLKPHLYRDHERDELIANAGPNDLVITSYQLVQRDAERFASRPWNTLVLDEAQFIKNAQTKTAIAVRSIEADWRLALTGTPMENHLGELWSLFRTISPGLLGSWDRFRREFADPIQRDRDPNRQAALSRVLQPFLLRRTKHAVLKELPQRTEIVREAELSAAERKRYDDARLAALAELTGAVQHNGETDAQKRVRILAWLTRLRQLACHPRLVDASWKRGSAKMDLFLEIVEELREGGHRALVFSQFVQHLKLVSEALDKAKIGYQYLDGGTPAGERQKRVDQFQSGEGDLFLISLKAGGTGLNLTAADYVLHLDPWWNPAVEDQATDRAHRMGQTRPVTVYRLVATKTIEQQILELHASKRELVSAVLEGSERAAKLSTDELISLIRQA